MVIWRFWFYFRCFFSWIVKHCNWKSINYLEISNNIFNLDFLSQIENSTWEKNNVDEWELFYKSAENCHKIYEPWFSFCRYFKGYYICKVHYFYAKMMVIDFWNFVNIMAYLDSVFPKIEKLSSHLFTFTILKFPIEFKIVGYQMWLDSFFDIGTFFKIPCTDTLFEANTSGNKISLDRM